ncbi:MAG: hypothetical protein ACYSSN_11740 [Planctomycetota bacterium]
MHPQFHLPKPGKCPICCLKTYGGSNHTC